MSPKARLADAIVYQVDKKLYHDPCKARDGCMILMRRSF
jgi:hypothetical protein